MQNQDVAFIRKNGRIIPIPKKDYDPSRLRTPMKKSGSGFQKKSNFKPQYESRSQKIKSEAKLGAAITGGVTAATFAKPLLKRSIIKTAFAKPIKKTATLAKLRSTRGFKVGKTLGVAAAGIALAGAVGAIPGAIIGGAAGAVMPRKKLKNKKVKNTTPTNN